MPNLNKLLSKLGKEERRVLEPLIEAVISLDWKNLDIKKLKEYQNIFRVHKGKIRIVFTKNKRDIFILAIERRREDTYKFLR